MKFNLNKGIVTLTSESQEEALVLFAIATRPDLTQKEVPVKKNGVKVCDLCGKGFKGSKGLGNHKSKIHGVRTDKTLKNQMYYRLRKAKLNQMVDPKPQKEFSEIWK